MYKWIIDLSQQRRESYHIARSPARMYRHSRMVILVYVELCWYSRMAIRSMRNCIDTRSWPFGLCANCIDIRAWSFSLLCANVSTLAQGLLRSMRNCIDTRAWSLGLCVNCIDIRAWSFSLLCANVLTLAHGHSAVYVELYWHSRMVTIRSMRECVNWHSRMVTSLLCANVSTLAQGHLQSMRNCIDIRAWPFELCGIVSTLAHGHEYSMRELYRHSRMAIRSMRELYRHSRMAFELCGIVSTLRMVIRSCPTLAHGHSVYAELYWDTWVMRIRGVREGVTKVRWGVMSIRGRVRRGMKSGQEGWWGVKRCMRRGRTNECITKFNAANRMKIGCELVVMWRFFELPRENFLPCSTCRLVTIVSKIVSGVGETLWNMINETTFRV